MAAPIPPVEVTDDARALGIGRPDYERDTRYTLVFERMRAEFFPESQVSAFADEVEVEFAERWAEGVRIAVRYDVVAEARVSDMGRARGR